MTNKKCKLTIGDRVKISMPIHNRYCNGIVQSIDGYNVYVKLNYNGIIVHRYVKEVTKKE